MVTCDYLFNVYFLSITVSPQGPRCCFPHCHVCQVHCNGLHVVSRSNVGWKSTGVNRGARMLRGRESGAGQSTQRSCNIIKVPGIKPHKKTLVTHTQTLPILKAVTLLPLSTDWGLDDGHLVCESCRHEEFWPPCRTACRSASG